MSSRNSSIKFQDILISFFFIICNISVYYTFVFILCSFLFLVIILIIWSFLYYHFHDIPIIFCIILCELHDGRPHYVMWAPRWLAVPSTVGVGCLDPRRFPFSVAPDGWPHLLLWAPDGWPHGGIPLLTQSSLCGIPMAGPSFSLPEH